MDKRRLIALISVVCLFTASMFGQTLLIADQYAESGKLKFDKPATLEQNINLAGEWEFYYDKTPGQISFMLRAHQKPDAIIKVPGFWNDTIKEITGLDEPMCKGTYRMVVSNLIPGQEYGLLMKECPETSCAILVNGNLVAITGDPFHEKKDGFMVSHSSFKPLVGSFYPQPDGTAEIEVFINNYFYRKSGMIDSIILGQKKRIFSINNIISSFNIFVTGLLLFLGILNLIQFFINKTKKEYFYVALISLGFAIRVVTAGYSSIGILFPDFPGELKIKLEYIAIWLTPPCILAMMHLLYPPKAKTVFGGMKIEKFQHSVNGIPLLFGVLTFILPAKIANRLVPLMEIVCGLFILYGFFFMIVNAIRKKSHIWYYFASFLILIVGLSIDMVFTQVKGVFPISLFPFFLVAFSFVQIALMARIQHETFGDTIVGSNKLKKINDNYARFVPLDTLKLINEESVLAIKRGDCINSEMSIMYTKFNISKHHSSDFENVVVNEETQLVVFSQLMPFINEIVKKHDGVVTTCAGTAFYAIFPDSPNEATIAALEMEEKLKTELTKFSEKGILVDHHTGLHYSSMVLGAVGEEDNVVTTIISSAVSVVTKIEESCEIHDKPMVASRPFKEHLLMNRLKGLCLVELESINVKGYLHPLELFDCIFINGGDLDI